MHALPGWYPDPSAPGTIRYWGGQEWTAHTAPASQVATYPAPAPFWPEQAGPWANPYAATSSQPTGPRTAALVTLGLILGVVVMVLIAELSHLRHQRASAAGTVAVPTYAPQLQPSTSGLLPANIAGLSLNPQSQLMAHHLTTQAESELSPSGHGITIGYYQTPAGSSKVFIEMITGAAPTNSRDAWYLLSQLEASFADTIGVPVGSSAQPGWTREQIGAANSVMGCENVTQMKTPIRACAFVQGTTVGVIGVYQPAPADGPLIDEVRREITGT
jgi:hypothetical protein